MNNILPMFVHHRREKLLNAMSYFVRNTRHCHTLKLFKLLFLLDFEHYRQTGRSVTGLGYHAFPMGPVPRKLYDEIRRESEEGASALGVRETFDDISGDILEREFTLNNKLDESYFTPREMEIMKRLVFFFGDAKADTMSAYSHDSKLPWKKVYGKGEGRGRVIPYELALRTEPLVNDEPTIEDEEIQMLDEVFEGTGIR